MAGTHLNSGHKHRITCGVDLALERGSNHFAYIEKCEPLVLAVIAHLQQRPETKQIQKLYDEIVKIDKAYAESFETSTYVRIRIPTSWDMEDSNSRNTAAQELTVTFGKRRVVVDPEVRNAYRVHCPPSVYPLEYMQQFMQWRQYTDATAFARLFVNRFIAKRRTMGQILRDWPGISPYLPDNMLAKNEGVISKGKPNFSEDETPENFTAVEGILAMYSLMPKKLDLPKSHDVQFL